MSYRLTTLIFLTAIFLIFISRTRLYGCVNEYQEERVTTVSGKSELRYDYNLREYTFSSLDLTVLEKRKAELENDLGRMYTFRKESDYAVVLLKLGEVSKALEILERLVKKHPDEYPIVVNLGTAYELNGQDESALYYITKAVKINPDSHEGSEWIHINILKTKHEMKRKGAGYLKSHPILKPDLNFQKAYTEKEIAELTNIREQLYWQLSERMAFVKPSDAVVGDLLFTLANLIAVTDYLEASVPLYDLALKYKPVNYSQVTKIRKEVKMKIFWMNFWAKTKYILTALLLITFTVVLCKILRRRKKTLKERIPVFNSVHLEKWK